MQCIFGLNPDIDYRKVSNIRRTLVGNKFVDHSDVVGASPVFILNLTRGFNGSDKDNCKTRRETFMFGDWAHLILENWRYMSMETEPRTTPQYIPAVIRCHRRSDASVVPLASRVGGSRQWTQPWTRGKEVSVQAGAAKVNITIV